MSRPSKKSDKEKWFELTVTGMCIMRFIGDKMSPDAVEIFLVDVGGGHEHPHYPLLCFDPRNLPAGNLPAGYLRDYTLTPDSYGYQMGGWNVSREVVTISGGKESEPPKPEWGENLGSAPTDKEEKYLNWLIALQDVENDILGDFQNHAAIAARIVIKTGQISAANFPKYKTNECKLFDYVVPDEAGAGPAKAQAGAIKVRFPVSEGKPAFVASTGPAGDWMLELNSSAGAENVAVSITNLPNKEIRKAPPNGELRHFLHFYDVFWDHGDPDRPANLRVPKYNDGPATTSGLFCPPVIFP